MQSPVQSCCCSAAAASAEKHPPHICKRCCCTCQQHKNNNSSWLCQARSHCMWRVAERVRTVQSADWPRFVVEESTINESVVKESAEQQRIVREVLSPEQKVVMRYACCNGSRQRGSVEGRFPQLLAGRRKWTSTYLLTGCSCEDREVFCTRNTPLP